MKRKLSMILFVVMMVSLLAVGCGGSKDKEESAGSDGEKIVLQFGHIQAADHALTKATEQFKELVEEKTDGRVEIELYPASQLGSAREMMEQISMGTLDITFADAADWATTFEIPELGVFNLPFLCKNLDQQTEILKAVVPEEVPKMIEGSGLRLLMTYSNGIRNPLIKDKPFTCLEDIKGVKMRTAETDLYVQIWNALGASTVTSAWSEAYTVFQQGVADAVEADDVGLVSMNLQEIGKYYSKIGHLGQAYLVMINEEKWESIPEDLQEIITECAEENQEKQWADRAELGEEAEKTMEEAGVKINEISDEERARMKEACSSIYEKYAEEYKLADLIDKMEEVAQKVE